MTTTSSTLSTSLGSRGKVLVKKKIGLLVPPRYIAPGSFTFN
jgi:hypothetical protein